MSPRLRVPGAHGGVVRRPFRGANRAWAPGDPISAQEASEWPPTARLAAEKAGTVDWYRLPEGPDRMPLSVVVQMADGTEILGTLDREGDELVVRVEAPVPTSSTRRSAGRSA